jgi:polyphosphate kinase
VARRKIGRQKKGPAHIITDLLKQIPYEKTPRPKIELPKRDKAHGYVEHDYSSKVIPGVF